MKTILALGLLSLLPLQPAKYDLVWKPKARQKLVYTMRLTGTLQDQPLNISSEMLVAVKKVEPNGNYILGTVHRKTVTKVLGQTERMPDGPEEIGKFDSRGRSLDPEDPNEEDDVISEIIGRAAEIEPPPKPVAVGESWTHEFAENKKIGLPKAKATYKLLSMSNGKLYVSIHCVESSGSAPTKIRGTEIIRARDGASLAVDTRIENVRIIEGQAATNLRFTMKLK